MESPKNRSNTELYRLLYRIRHFEETVLENFPKGVFFGTTHTYLGQEANAVGVLSHLQRGDIVFSNHRCHGHFLAYGGDMRALFAEMMGKASGVCAGRGGSQHLQWRDFYSNGVQGGIVPIATGMAMAEKIKGSGNIVIVFIGDGTLGEGVVYESLNIASLWSAPILFVVENNQIAQTTPTEIAIAGSISARFNAFGIQATELHSSDVVEITTIAGDQIDDIRQNKSPSALILNTHRFGPHSKGDDTRSPDMVNKLREKWDPISIQAARLSDGQKSLIEKETDSAVTEAFNIALNDPIPEIEPIIGSTLSRRNQGFTS